MVARVWTLVLASAAAVLAVVPGSFKKCDDSSVCRRFRGIAERTEQHAPYTSPYTAGEARWLGDELVLPVRSALYSNISFEIRLSFFEDGNARVQMDEVSERYGGWRHYDQAAMWGVATMPTPAKDASVGTLSGGTEVSWGSPVHKARIEHDPLRIVFQRDGVDQVVLNGRSLLHMEHFRAKSNVSADDRARAIAAANPQASAAIHQQWAAFEAPDDGAWEETWNGVRDSKPKGPEGVSLDVSFPGYGTLFGLPEHASPLSLRSTRAAPAGETDEPGRFTDPYRLMNTDVFEYEYNSPMSLYGSAPILHAQSRGSAAAVLWMNAAETWIDLHKTRSKPAAAAHAVSEHDGRALAGGTSAQTSHAHFFSESGILDLFVFLGPSGAHNMERFTALTGRTALPQYFALGYHQSRWNYLTDGDVLDVSARFDEADIPMDVMWLDIEYAKEHMYAVWDRHAFKDPERMMRELDARGRKLVIIVDPHLKMSSDYFLYQEAKQRDLLVHNKDGSVYEGECWSGHASWIDFFNPATWPWWISQWLLPNRKILANARNLFVWNDMSEPAIFSGPEVTSPKDVVHYGGWEHRDVHNINGLILHNLTSQGLTRRELGMRDAAGRPGIERRPFVLSRAWWLGTQRFGAIWTGDNMGTWEHFANSVPMILANGVGGMSFCGADIGGFFGNPDTELLVRWYQAGIWEPFFRAHAHIDTKRREPYLFDEPVRRTLRGLLQLRYRMLPVWYTAFWTSHVSGQPVLRPQYLVFPHDEAGFAVDDQYYLGDSGLLVKPPARQGVEAVDVYLADDEPYYHYFTHHEYVGRSHNATVPAPLTDAMPVLIRGGSIVSVRERDRRAAEMQRRDPFTLYVAVGRTGEAHGSLYLDDGQTLQHRHAQAFLARHFTWSQDGAGFRLASAALRPSHVGAPSATDDAFQQHGNEFEEDMRGVRVERVVVLGLTHKPRRVLIRGAHDMPVDFTWSPAERLPRTAIDSSSRRASRLVVRDPKLPIAGAWELLVE